MIRLSRPAAFVIASVTAMHCQIFFFSLYCRHWLSAEPFSSLTPARRRLSPTGDAPFDGDVFH
jgi:hypothetical protein